MSIRFKVLSIAVTLLIIFGIVIAYSTIHHRRLTVEIGAVGEYNLPIRATLSDFDVTSHEYELIVLRLARQSNVVPGEVESESARARAEAEKMRKEVGVITSLLDQAVGDGRLPEESRQFYSELKAAFPFVVRHLDGFIATGERVLAAIAEGRSEESRALSLDFRKTERAFGPDIALMRQKLAASSEHRFQQILKKMRGLERISYVLFALAIGLGIVVGWLVAENIVRGLRRIVAVSKAVQAGERDISVPVRTNDEVGQL